MEYETILARHRPGAALRADLLLMPGVSLMTCAGAADPLRAANRVAGRRLFDWRFVSVDGAAVATSAGVAMPVAGRLDPEAPRDILAVIAGFRAREMDSRAVQRAIFRAARGAALVIGAEAGSWLLARAGLLEGRAAATHWEDHEDFAAAFPGVDLRPDRIVADGPLLTTSGAAPTFAAMIGVVGARAGPAVALEAAAVFDHDLGRRAPAPGPADSGRLDPRLMHAIALMQDHLDAPPPVAAIAARVGLSPRGLELLFRRDLGRTPGRHFLTLRLGAARKMLLDTALPVAEIAARTGFGSGAAFARAYRAGFGLSPRRDRAAARPALPAQDDAAPA